MRAELSKDKKEWECTGCKDKHTYKFEAEKCNCRENKIK